MKVKILDILPLEIFMMADMSRCFTPAAKRPPDPAANLDISASDALGLL